MDEALYNKQIICPVCNKAFNTTRTKMGKTKISDRDTDFCVYYENINPLFYDAIVCTNCGYSAISDKFDTITDKEKELIKENISKRWNNKDYSGERTVEEALECLKLVLINLKIRSAKSSEIARACLRIAWLYRMMNQPQKEIEFMTYAVEGYMEAFNKERFPLDKLDEPTTMYLIGELHRRTGNNKDAVQWFNKVVNSQAARANAKLIEMAREQWQTAKAEMKEANQWIT